MTKRLALGLATCILTLGCGADPDAGFGIEKSAIINGDPSDATDDAVVELFSRISDVATLGCSGTLIAPDVLITALHCVTYRENPDATFTCKPDGSIVPNTPGAGELGLPIDGDRITVNYGPDGTTDTAMGLRVFGSGATQICRGDLAAVVLDRELGDKFVPVRFGRAVSRGEAHTAIGYGQTENGFGMGRHRRDVTVLDVGDVGTVPATGPTPPDTFVVGPGPCHGDSGGPALAQETGAITGVYSLTLSPSCTSATVKNTYTLVSQFEDTIREALEFAGREPVIEEGSGGSSGTGGSAGTSGAGTSGASGNEGTGSGSRDDATCACRATGGRTKTGYGWAGLILALGAVVRRRSGKVR